MRQEEEALTNVTVSEINCETILTPLSTWRAEPPFLRELESQKSVNVSQEV